MEEKEDLILNYVCPRCFHNIYKCKCDSKPYYSLWWIDRNIQEIIRILNQKGYKTQYSCESHDPQSTIYISFMNRCQPDHTIPAPNGFELKGGGNIIEHKYGKDSRARKKMTMEEFEAEKKECLANLLEWAKALPEQ